MNSCPSIPISVRVDLILSILRICHVIASLRESTPLQSTFAIMSYAPKVPCISLTHSTFLSASITSSSEPRSQFIKTYAVANLFNLQLLHQKEHIHTCLALHSKDIYSGNGGMDFHIKYTFRNLEVFWNSFLDSPIPFMLQEKIHYSFLFQ